MTFAHPRILWFLPVLVPLLIAFFWWSWQKKRQLVGRFIAARLLANLTVGVSAPRQKARLGLVAGAVALLIVVLAGPQIGFSWEEARSRGLDIVVAIDTSRSMLATDVAPNRLRRAQLAALDLKRLARADRLGLVAFAGGAFLQCPLTLDDEAFRQSVEALDVTIIPQGGTALAEAIAAAKSAFKDGNDNHKVLVLFTDGEDHDGNAVEAATAAAKEGLRIFTIGVGTAGGELLRTVDVQGRTEFIKDADGNAVKSRLNETLLQDMARVTGGFYMLLSGARTMNLLYERGLAPLPKGDLASQRVKRPHEWYQWLLGLALALLLAEMFLPERKAASTRATAPAGSGSTRAAAAAGAGAANPPGASNAATASKVAAALGLAVASTFAFGAFPSAASTSDGLKQYQKGRYDRAVAEYERALQKKPEDARLQFNAGTAALQNKDYDQALGHLNSALITTDLSLQQRSYYNLGNTQFRQGEGIADLEKKRRAWEQAIRSYDSALKLNDKDADAEFNRDLVKRKLEELKQQQQQQKQNEKNEDKDKDQDKDKNDKDQQKDSSKRDQQNKDQQAKDQQKRDEQKKQQDQAQQNQKDKEKEKEQQQAQQNKDKQDGEDKQGQQAKPQEEGQEQDGDAAPQPRAIRMTPQQAVQLLEALKGDEKVLMFRPTRTNRQDRVFKDW